MWMTLRVCLENNVSNELHEAIVMTLLISAQHVLEHSQLMSQVQLKP